MNDPVFWLALGPFAAWIWLMAFRGGFWRADRVLDPRGSEGKNRDLPPIAVVIPARNEADVIAGSLASVVGQDYAGPLDIVVVDDCSTDRTAERAGAFAGVRIVRGGDRPPGWTGKLWAVSQGIAACGNAPYLWLTDADIHHDPGELAALVAEAEDGGLDLVSLMVRLRLETFWDRLLIPAFVFFFQKLYPFRWVNEPDRKTAAAAGGSMLVRRAALDRIGGLEAIRGELIDDCALAARIKGSGGAVQLWLSTRTVSLRAYRSLGEIWRMVARSAFDQLRYSSVLLAGTVLGMVWLYLVPPAALVFLPLHGSWTAAGLGLAAWVMMAWAEAPTLYRYGLNPWRGFALPVAAALYTLMTVDSARRHWSGRGGEWKGRTHRS